MKKVLAGFAALCLAAGLGLALCGAALPGAARAPEDASVSVSADYDWTRFAGENLTLNVYNWGEYISEGDDGFIDVNAEFEALTGINVNYTLYDTNEALYSKLKSGGADYDIIVPSDYMIGRMINEGMLAPLDFANIPNFANIGEAYKGLDFDAANAYSVPYTWGYVGIVYNTTMVQGVPDSWEYLWDEAYSGNILMFDNSRDAFAIALKKLGLSLNPSSTDDIDRAAAELLKQKAVVQGYVMDQIYDKMGGGEAALAPYYAGDAVQMMQDNPSLAFAVPKEGTNYFVDSLCVPAGSRNKEAAEMYINFLCEPAVAADNAMVIGYSTPVLPAQDLLPDEIKNDPIRYPSAEILANTEAFNVLPDELNTAMDKAWSDMRGGSENGAGWVIPVALALAVVLMVVVLLRRRAKQRRNDY